LASITRVGPGVSIEVFFAQPQHFLQPRFVRAEIGIIGSRGKLRAQRRLDRLNGRAEPVIGKAAIALFSNQSRIF
jgi:hypothetical protein